MQGEYLIYLRKSRADLEAEKHGEGETLARHQAQLLDLAKRKDLTVGGIYKELVSGETIAARPQMQRVLAEVGEGKWAGVLVMEIERLARGDTIDQGLVAQAFKFSGTKIITPLKTYDPLNEYDEEYFEFSLFMSRREYKTIRRRMQAGRVASVKEGNYIGSQPPYGYRKVRDYNNNAFTLEPIEEEAKAVKLMYELYTTKDMGYYKIATYLNQLGLKPKKADTWCASSVKDIIENPIYCGKLRWNRRKQQKIMRDGVVVISRPKSQGDLYQGSHPAIIPEELFNAAQAVPKKGHSSVHFDRPLKNFFVGLLYCDKCGHAMVRRPYPDSDAQYMCTHKGCDCVGSYETAISELMLSSITQHYKRLQVELQRGIKSKPASKTNVSDDIIAEIDKLKKQHNKLYDLLEREIYTPEVFVERSTTIKQRIAELEELLKNEQQNKPSIPPEEAIMILKNILDNFNKLEDAQDKNNLLKTAINRINYKKSRKGGKIQQSSGDMELYIDYKF